MGRGPLDLQSDSHLLLDTLPTALRGPVLTLCRPIHFYIKFDTVKLEWSIVFSSEPCAVNLEIFAKNSFKRHIPLKRHIDHAKNSGPEHDLFPSVNDSVFDVSQWYYIHKTSHLGSFAKTIPSRKFLNLQNSEFTVLKLSFCDPLLSVRPSVNNML